jgi:anti-sigma regulatory factor (Ser/Thr protein kinase)
VAVTPGSGPCSLRVAVDDATGVGEARRTAQSLARRLGMDDTAAGHAALVATEMATNVLKHGRRGEILVRAAWDVSRAAVDVVALDKGPGMANLGQSLSDGFSTSATPGTGLGAIRRAASVFDVFTAPGQGTVVLARVGPPPADGPWQCDGTCVAKRGETVSGDRWAMVETPTSARVMVADGLGHGPDAATASDAAVACFLARPELALVPLLEECHGALRPTRGAAVAIAEVDVRAGEVRFAGVGNIAASLRGPGGAMRSMVSLNGTLGHAQVRVREFAYPWTPAETVVMASDGLKTHWSLTEYPGLGARRTSLLTALLYRDHQRGSDDVTVVALRRRPEAP